MSPGARISRFASAPAASASTTEKNRLRMPAKAAVWQKTIAKNKKGIPTIIDGLLDLLPSYCLHGGNADARRSSKLDGKLYERAEEGSRQLMKRSRRAGLSRPGKHVETNEVHSRCAISEFRRRALLRKCARCGRGCPTVLPITRHPQRIPEEGTWALAARSARPASSAACRRVPPELRRYPLPGA